MPTSTGKSTQRPRCAAISAASPRKLRLIWTALIWITVRAGARQQGLEPSAGLGDPSRYSNDLAQVLESWIVRLAHDGGTLRVVAETHDVIPRLIGMQ